ncbi:ECF transporter S component [Ruminococcus flavefaciens]|uniref:Energy-coupling factor transport system substrate-specific component n=1 Tax=Ruminococcus flavefaciens TaxID=1265 RepID=A0A1M7LW19_RUMFL|nr:ECF transporter S component [Ruminococcus flavefaciens]SHM82545.1 energy-coupling factor transport system substrate-specific component [Ruminococcus flavefaciens]
MLLIKSKKMRDMIRIAVPFIAVPMITIVGAVAFDEKKHIIISLAVAVSALLLFAAGFEKKSTGTRRMVIVAVMVALCFAGRFIPFLKPIAALTIITALYLGSEAGFLVGSLSAILSNFYFGQGPWTAFQMLAWGLIGFFAGLLADRLLKSRVLLLIYGAAAGLAYSFIMDIWTVLWYNQGFDINLYLAALVTAIPYTVSYAVSNVLFLYLLAPPFGEKLQRIKIKYGV